MLPTEYGPAFVNGAGGQASHPVKPQMPAYQRYLHRHDFGPILLQLYPRNPAVVRLNIFTVTHVIFGQYHAAQDELDSSAALATAPTRHDFK